MLGAGWIFRSKAIWATKEILSQNKQINRQKKMAIRVGIPVMPGLAWEVETGGPRIQSHLCSFSELGGSLDYMSNYMEEREGGKREGGKERKESSTRRSLLLD